VLVDTTETPGMTTRTNDRPADPGAVTGLMLGLFGYLLALVAFGYEGLFTGNADAATQLAAGLTAAYLVASVASLTGLIAVLRNRGRHPRLAAGLVAGMTLGIVLLVLLSVRIFGLMDDVSSTCPCEPIIDQVRISE
jgi:hypothetical protein